MRFKFKICLLALSCRSISILLIYEYKDGLRVDFDALRSLEYEERRTCSQLSIDLSKQI